MDHHKGTYAMFGLPNENKNSTENPSLPFLTDFFKLKEKDHISRKINSKQKVYR